MGLETETNQNRNKYSFSIFILIMGGLIFLSLAIALGSTYLSFVGDRNSYKMRECFVQNIQIIYGENCNTCDNSGYTYIPSPIVEVEKKRNMRQLLDCGSGCSTPYWEVDFFVSYYVLGEQVNATIKENYNDEGVANSAIINHYLNTTAPCYHKYGNYYQIDWNLPHSNYLIIGIVGLVSILLFTIILFLLAYVIECYRK
jgi:hypothetical protein